MRRGLFCLVVTCGGLVGLQGWQWASGSDEHRRFPNVDDSHFPTIGGRTAFVVNQASSSASVTSGMFEEYLRARLGAYMPDGLQSDGLRVSIETGTIAGFRRCIGLLPSGQARLVERASLVDFDCRRTKVTFCRAKRSVSIVIPATGHLSPADVSFSAALSCN